MSFLHRVCGCLIVIVMGMGAAQAQVPGPTPEHAKLKKHVGKWEFVLKDAQNQESKGISETTEECGGMWYVSTFKTDFGGVPFQGRGLDGYDPAKKKYISVWVDSFTPAPMIFEGQFDEAGKVLTMICEGKAPDSDTPATWRSTTKFVGDNEQVFEMFLKPKGADEMKMMVVTYKRVK
jgi:hypothetical protein